MNPLKLTISSAVALLLLLVLASQTISTKDQTAQPVSAGEPGVLRVGTDGTAPAYYSEGGRIKGFDYEMAEGVGQALGLKVKWVKMDFDNLLPAVSSGKIDMVAAEMTDTPEREQQADFSTPYFVTYLTFLTPMDSAIKRRSDVNGKRIAVVAGTIQETYAKTKYKNVKVVVRKDEDSAVKAVADGQADAFFYDASYADPIIKSAAAKGVKLDKRIVYAADDAPIAFAMRKGDPRKAKVNDAINQMLVGGDWMRIKKEYFKAYPLSELFASKGVS